jgi:hypothetical protein
MSETASDTQIPVGIRELAAHEVEGVSGGNPLTVVLTVYGVADLAYDAFKGFRDGFSARAN